MNGEREMVGYSLIPSCLRGEGGREGERVREV